MNRLFLINTLTAWNEPPRARHQFTFALAKDNQVVFVERNKTGKTRITVEKVHENITLITPYFPIDYRFRYRLPIISDIYQNWLYRQLVERYSNSHIVVNFDFSAHRIIKHFKRVIYYCNDEFKGNSKYRNCLIETYKSYCERQIIKNAIFCVATSRFLYSKLLQNNPKTYEIPLGVSAVNNNLVYRNPIRQDTITVCLMGVINERNISVSLINSLLKEDPFKLILIGPVENSFVERLKFPEKVIIKEVLRGNELLDALASVDIGLALYNLKRVNPGATPNKLWQYLSAGIPVVISALPNLMLEDFPKSSVYVLYEEKQLKDLVYQAYRENSEKLFNARLAFALANTWDKRVEVFMEKLKIHSF